MSTALRSVVVAQTWFLASGGYEIEVSPDLDRDAPRTVLLTRDDAIYTMAAVAEGYPIRFDATCRSGRRRNGRNCEVLETFTPADSSHQFADVERTDAHE